VKNFAYSISIFALISVLFSIKSYSFNCSEEQKKHILQRFTSNNTKHWKSLCGSGAREITLRSFDGELCDKREFKAAIEKCINAHIAGFKQSKCYAKYQQTYWQMLEKANVSQNTASKDILVALQIVAMQSPFRKALEEGQKNIDYNSPIDNSIIRLYANNIADIKIIYANKYTLALGAHDTVYIAFSGIQSLGEMVKIGSNVLTARDKKQLGPGYAHRGFKKIFDKIWPELNQKLIEYAQSIKQNITYRISGFSMGGALATLTGLKIAHSLEALQGDKDNIFIITFGMPRMLSKKIAESYDEHLGKNTLRVFLENDPIPNQTPRYFYHVGEPLFINIGSDRNKYKNSHRFYTSFIIHKELEEKYLQNIWDNGPYAEN
jgi:uncharacterized CHY-type Zn-finger protein